MTKHSSPHPRGEHITLKTEDKHGKKQLAGNRTYAKAKTSKTIIKSFRDRKDL